MTARRIEYLDLDTLKANPANAKLHDTEGIGQSIGRFGLVEIIAVDGRTGYLVSGHGRTDSLRQMRARNEWPPDGIIERDGKWLVPVITGWSSRDDDEAFAATVSINRWGERGGWNVDTFLAQLDRIAAGRMGLEGVGVDQADMDELLAQHQAALPDEDDWGLGDQDRQVRSIMLDLPVDDYRWATEVCRRARGHYQVDSNAVLFLRLLEEDAELARQGPVGVD